MLIWLDTRLYKIVWQLIFAFSTRTWVWSFWRNVLYEFVWPLKIDTSTIEWATQKFERYRGRVKTERLAQSPGHQWVLHLVKQGIAMLIMILIMLCIFGCLISCAIKVVKKTFNSIWVAQKQKGGFVGFLEKQGHIVSNPDTLNMD